MAVGFPPSLLQSLMSFHALNVMSAVAHAAAFAVGHPGALNRTGSKIAIFVNLNFNLKLRMIANGCHLPARTSRVLDGKPFAPSIYPLGWFCDSLKKGS